MIQELSPRLQFQQLTEVSKSFRAMTGDLAFRTAVTYAMAQVIHGDTTTEELSGAKKFLAALFTLADPITKQKLPTKSLTSLETGPPNPPQE